MSLTTYKFESSLYFHYFEIFVDDRRTAHAENINNSRNIVTMYPGDIFLVRTAVQSDKNAAKVAKLCYAVRGIFQIIRSAGRGSYIVRKLNKLDKPEF